MRGFHKPAAFTLSPRNCKEQAQATYDKWQGNKEKYGLADYVSYVQKREAERQDAPDLQKKLDAPLYQAGEIVVVREPRKDGNTGRVHKVDQTKAEDYLRCLGVDKSELQGIEATKQALDDRAKMRQRSIDVTETRKARRQARGPRGG